MTHPKSLPINPMTRTATLNDHRFVFKHDVMGNVWEVIPDKQNKTSMATFIDKHHQGIYQLFHRALMEQSNKTRTAVAK